MKEILWEPCSYPQQISLSNNEREVLTENSSEKCTSLTSHVSTNTSWQFAMSETRNRVVCVSNFFCPDGQVEILEKYVNTFPFDIDCEFLLYANLGLAG